jgi:hypothetical protein
MFYAHIYNSAEGTDAYFQFEDAISIQHFIRWTKFYINRITTGNWLEHCNVILDEPAAPLNGDELPKDIIPFIVQDDMDAENWLNVFQDNDVYSANDYLEELIESFLELNAIDS